MTNSTKETPMLLTVPQAAELMQIGRDTAYNLTHIPGFPAIRIGRSVRISREGLQSWLDKQNGGVTL